MSYNIESTQLQEVNQSQIAFSLQSKRARVHLEPDWDHRAQMLLNWPVRFCSHLPKQTATGKTVLQSLTEIGWMFNMENQPK